MAQGLPDWHRKVLLFYGSAIQDAGTTDCPDGVETTLFEVEGQGIIYDGLVMSGNSDPSVTYIRIKVDDISIFYRTVLQLFNDNITGNHNFRMSVARYIAASDTFSALINAPITFDVKFNISIKQATGVQKTIYHNLLYAKTP